MGTIFFHLHSWGSGGIFLQNFMARHREELADKGLIYANTEYEIATYAENHQQLCMDMLRSRSQADALPEYIGNVFSEWQKELEKGKNILVSFRPFELGKNFLGLHSLFSTLQQFQTHEKKYFISLGRHDFAIEENQRSHPFLEKAKILEIMKKIDSFETFLKRAIRIGGQHRVSVQMPILPPCHDNREELSALAGEFLKFVNIESLEPDESDFVEFPWRSVWLRQIVASINNAWRKPSCEELTAEMTQVESDPIGKRLFSMPETIAWVKETYQRDWEKAREITGKPEKWQFFAIPESAADIPFKNFSHNAPLTAEFIRNNYHLVPDQWKGITGHILAEAGLELPKAPDLSVLTMAYNHEKYIGECIKSVCGQKRNFSMEHIIVDDCSQDDTRKIIAGYAKDYPHIRPVFLERKWGKNNIVSLFSSCKSRYAALCDGDDYFTDMRKLQKQYNYLERNRDCSICAHPVHVHFTDGKHKDFVYPPLKELPHRKDGKLYLEDLFRTNFIQTNSAVYRWRFRDGIPPWFRADICPSDWYWHLLHAETGRIGFLPEVMSVYLRHDKAYYANAFIAPLKHRQERGMQELETYKVVNEHFRGRYFEPLSALANGVLANFLETQMKNEDMKLLDEAEVKYPEFVKAFLNSLTFDDDQV